MIDNATMVQYFGKHILAGPEEELLESYYLGLGARWISSMVKTETITNNPLTQQTANSQALRTHVLERLTIFLAEARRKQSEISIETLKQEGKFVISEVRGLQVKYTLRQARQEHSHFEVSITRASDTSLELTYVKTLYATARKSSSKVVTLTVSVTADPDDYE